MGTLVMKFGGLSVGTTTALTQVLSIVLHENTHWDRLLLVVSALEGVTDALVDATRLAQVSNRRGYRRIAANVRTRHLALIDHLPLGNNERQAIQADIDRLLFDLLDALQHIADQPREELTNEITDTIIGVGERLTARIVAALIRQNNIRAVAIDTDELIITDNVFGNATPNLAASCERIQKNLLPMLDRDIIPVITGFIGTTPDGRQTTMGRGGSDYTASIIGVCANADETWIWTDVDGMMTTDPHDVESARVIPSLSYEEVGEMAYFGARVLHARMIGPLRDAQIPLRVKNVFFPQKPGTLIHSKSDPHPDAPKAVTTIQALSLSTDKSGSLSEVATLVNDVLLQTAGNPAEVMISSQSSDQSFLCFVIPTSAGPDAIRISTEALQSRFDQVPELSAWVIRPVSVVTVIGSRALTPARAMSRILDQLDSITLLGLAQGPSNSTFSVIVAPDDAFEVQQRIHNLILSQSDDVSSD